MRRKLILLSFLISFFVDCLAQRPPKDTAIANYSSFKRAVSFAGLLQPRYTVSLNKDVDVNGVNFDNTKKGVTNSFSLRRVRFQIRAQINDHWDANVLVNFAEFSNSGVSGKVLENAYVRYSLNNHFRVMGGQFRPFIGIEDVVPVDFLRSLDFSNGYYAFGRNGWQSFQTGIAVFGDITKKGNLRYYVGANNGNGRNQTTDNDNGKHFYGRLEADLRKNITVGGNAGIGTLSDKKGGIAGADVKSVFDLSPKWKLFLNTVYKQGTNFYAYDSVKIKTNDIKDYRIKNFYIMPVIRYDLNHPRFRSVEFSSRYEILNETYKLDDNDRQTITPMVGFEFADNYFACLQIGANIDIYKKNIPKTAVYDHSTMVAQLQVRF